MEAGNPELLPRLRPDEWNGGEQLECPEIMNGLGMQGIHEISPL
jgi:hypothetical protein